MRARTSLRDRRLRSALVAWVCIAAAAPGCAYLLRSPDRPTPAIHYSWSDGSASAPCLLVLLPGFLDEPEEFERHGLVEDLHRLAPSCDMVAVETHLYDYQDESIVERVHEDVVLVARERGYQQIWIAGVSMGALGAILTVRAHPEDVDGLILVSPYLGTGGFADHLEREVAAHGDLGSWAQATDDHRVNIARVLHNPRPVWRWLAGYQIAPDSMPPLYIAYGRDDRFAGAQRLLADLVSPERVFVIDGRHDWETWRRLFHEVIAVVPVAPDLDDGDSPPDLRRRAAPSIARRPIAAESW